MKTKITQESQPCRKCGTPVVKVIRNQNKPVKSKQNYYFLSYFDCPKCHTRYMNDDDKVFINNDYQTRVVAENNCNTCQFKQFFQNLKSILNNC